MRWQDFLSKVASSTAGAAAGAATLPVGGPIGAAAAGAAANKSTEALINEFVQAQNEQLNRIEAINQDMQFRLLRLEQGMSVLLDGPWRTALFHIREAANRPHHFNEEITEARNELGKAYAMSTDDLRCSWIAQDLAAVYALSGDFSSVRRWLASAYESGLKGLNDQIWQAAKTIESEAEKHTKDYERYRKDKKRYLASRPSTLSHVKFKDELSTPGPRPFKHTGFYEVFADTVTVFQLVQGLGKLFNDLAQLRRTCIRAGIDQSTLPLPYTPDRGGIRVATNFAGADFDTLTYFDTSAPSDSQLDTRVAIAVAGIELGPSRCIYVVY